MRNLFLFLLLLALPGTLLAQRYPVKLSYTGTPASHVLSWNTNPCYNYLLESSVNLQTWTIACNGQLPGTGDVMEIPCMVQNPPARLYYRIRELDPVLTRPCQGEQCFKEKGVVFAFNLNKAEVLTVNKICLSKRPVTTPASSWQPIGTLTDIISRNGMRTVRGPAVWIPNETGSCEVKAELKNSGGTVLTETRTININANSPPVVRVTGYNTVPPDGGFPGSISFTTVVSDPDEIHGDKVTRVDYYVRSAGSPVEIFMGTDFTAPFGEHPAGADRGIVSLMGNHSFSPNALLLGHHEIVARAYDNFGGMGQTPDYDPENPGNGAFTVNITTGQARPLLALGAENAYLGVPAGSSVENISFSIYDGDGANTIYGGSLFSILGTTQGSTAFYGNIIGGAMHGYIGPNLNTTNWPAGGHIFRLRAYDHLLGAPANASFEKYFTIQLDNDAQPSANPKYVRAQTMILGGTDPNGGPPILGLADPVSAPVPISSVRIYGPYRACQPFTGGLDAGSPTTRVMETGLLLTTGLFSSWNGNDDVDDRSYPWPTPDTGASSTWADKLLHDRNPDVWSRDGVTLEFDVDCPAYAGTACTQMEMELQYGSEEYPERIGDPAGTGYDGFMVTVDGALISLVPDGGAPISAMSIHPLIPAGSSEWIGNPELPALRDHLFVADDVPNSTQDINAVASASQVEFDGMTVRLRLHTFVSPGLHKVRISIADRDYSGFSSLNQGRYDSGVFLRTASLRTLAPIP